MFYSDLSGFDRIYLFEILVILTPLGAAAVALFFISRMLGTKVDAGEIFALIAGLACITAGVFALFNLPNKAAYDEYIVAKFNAEYGEQVELVTKNGITDALIDNDQGDRFSAVIDGEAYTLQMSREGNAVIVDVVEPRPRKCEFGACLRKTVNLNAFLAQNADERSEFAGVLVKGSDARAEITAALRERGIEFLDRNFPMNTSSTPVTLNGNTALVNVWLTDKTFAVDMVDLESERTVPILPS